MKTFLDEGILDEEEVLSIEGRGKTFAEIADRGINRRNLLKLMGAVSAAALIAPVVGGENAQAVTEAQMDGLVQGGEQATGAFQGDDVFPFQPLGNRDQLVVPPGYKVKTLISWGDPLFPDAPAFDPENQTAEAQHQQFGYNCDFVGFHPLPLGSDSSDHGLLFVNHEYTSSSLMFPGYDSNDVTEEQAQVELAAHGLTVVEIEQDENGEWGVVLDSQYNRRLNNLTEFELTGPVAGADRVKTSADATGTKVFGTLNNCAGGKTPWGTFLSGEENFHQYFGNRAQMEDLEAKALHVRYGLPSGASGRKWELYEDRFDLVKEPNEPFRFGWVVEVDPYDPESTPKKHTAMGRFRHEGATVVITPENKVVVYSGDDARFEYVYKFVSAGTYDPDDRAANMNLLSEGTLYVARFDGQVGDMSGSGEWLPLEHGNGPLNAANGFESQADVLINTRVAADLVGATKMDRPEDVETNPITGKVYVALTNNTQRKDAGAGDVPDEEVNAVNPRANNRNGHILEITPTNGDHAATTFSWDMFLLCGHPSDPSTYYGGYEVREHVSPIAAPDNVTFDRLGNLWISTDGQFSRLGVNDALFIVPVEGSNRGRLTQFFETVTGSEICGPEFTNDDTSLFLAIQHPGEGSGATYETPFSFWPDNQIPPRPSVVVIQGDDGEPIV